MKRFLIGAVLLLVFVVGGFWLIFYQGFYIDLKPSAPVSVPFKAVGKEIKALGENGNYYTLELKGVEMSATLPGESAYKFPPEEQDYLRWFEAIGEMGANLIRVYTPMDDDFYNALLTYNSMHDEPLYLLQGIVTSDAANNGVFTAHHDKFKGELIDSGREVIDIIHGRKDTYGNGFGDGERYRADVSPWVVGIIVGNEWNADTIAYTNHSAHTSTGYKGRFFSTSAGAGQFEAVLAEVMDTITVYETEKYKSQRLIGFASAPDIDFLEYKEDYARQLLKHVSIDAEHIYPLQGLKSGYFASYRLFEFCPDFSKYLSDEQTAVLNPLLDKIDHTRSYSGYMDLLASYHSMPVIIAGFGFTSARGTTVLGTPPLTEEEQGQKIVTVCDDARKAGCAGVCITSWQDSWERRGWNTAFATNVSLSYLWHDLQTAAEHYGIMSFDAGERPICIIDGDGNEWNNDTPVIQYEGVSVYLRYDSKGLYIFAKGDKVNEETPLYIPFDISPEVGSKYCGTIGLNFTRNADFLLCINGRTDSRLLVQERYDPIRANFGRELGQGDPFAKRPPKNSTNFVPVTMVLEDTTLLDDPSKLTAEEREKLATVGLIETGLLHYGNGDPVSRDYDSLTDFCFGKECVEIRLPWLLLNVAEPTEMHIHKDYYINYGVETMAAHSIWIGVGTGAEDILMAEVDVDSWEFDLAYRERLKQSYTVLQSFWKE